MITETEIKLISQMIIVSFSTVTKIARYLKIGDPESVPPQILYQVYD